MPVSRPHRGRGSIVWDAAEVFERGWEFNGRMEGAGGRAFGCDGRRGRRRAKRTVARIHLAVPGSAGAESVTGRVMELQL